MALSPKTRFGAYEILAHLGSGGMGEVYRARDLRLGRDVAIKVLPEEVVSSPEGLARIEREARTVARLNHPNIVTLHSVEDVGGIRFLTMELIEGQSLSNVIPPGGIPLSRVLELSIPLADALGVAHERGVIHRDLKPGNVMVTRDGRLKVLDFGIARQVSPQGETDETITGPPSVASTKEGLIVGTIPYMAPEQLEGKPPDARSDIWAFGCILYEMATGSRAFQGGSTASLVSAILRDEPEPISSLVPLCPVGLDRLVKACLRKDPRQRIQMAHDIKLQLQWLAEPDASVPASPKRTMKGKKGLIWILAGLLGLALILSVFRLRDGRRQGSTGELAPAIRISTVQIRGDVTSCAISPDGRYLAYSVTRDGNSGIRVRQVATGSDVEVVPPGSVAPWNLVFSPDGNYVYHSLPDPSRPSVVAVFRVPTLGGKPQKFASDVGSRITFAPDGRRICFKRHEEPANRDHLVIRDPERGQERILTTVAPPSRLWETAWSPNGEWIAVMESPDLVAYRVIDGRREVVRSTMRMEEMTWLPDGTGILVSALDPGSFTWGQLCVVSFPNGQVRRVTNDLAHYSNMSITADGATIASIQTRGTANLWSTTPRGPEVRQLSFINAEDGAVAGFEPARDGSIIFRATKEGGRTLWMLERDGSEPRPITARSGIAANPFYRPGGRIIYMLADDELRNHVWVAETSGENARQLTRGPGEYLLDVSPDGETALFTPHMTLDTLWSVSVHGGGPVSLGRTHRLSAMFSPNGDRIFHFAPGASPGGSDLVPTIIPSAGRGVPEIPKLPPDAENVRWSPDGKALTFVRSLDGYRNVYRLPLNGERTEQITHFQDGRIRAHRWSPDGKLLLLGRLLDDKENLWVTKPDGGDPVAVTSFTTGNISGMRWSLDGSEIIFVYGETSQNAVLIQSFR